MTDDAQIARSITPRPILEGLYGVGDSVLFGQSTLAVALGGVRTAEAIAGRSWRRTAFPAAPTQG